MEQSLPQLVLPIKIERSSERLTSLGGLVVLEELARALGVWKEVDRVLQGPKSGRGYRPREFVQRWCGCCTPGGGAWRTCGSWGRSARCESSWAWRRCRTPGRWGTGYGDKARRGRRPSRRSVGDWWRSVWSRRRKK